MIVNCFNCNKEFEKRQAEVNRNPRHFCSRSCAVSFSNRVSPKRSVEGFCKVCSFKIPASRSYCSETCESISIKKRSKSEDKKKADASMAVVSWRQRTKTKAIVYKGSQCQCCGYSKCSGALEFHHLDPAEKDFSISGKSFSWDKIKQELDKCALLCANCHREVHAGLINLSGT